MFNGNYLRSDTGRVVVTKKKRRGWKKLSYKKALWTCLGLLILFILIPSIYRFTINAFRDGLPTTRAIRHVYFQNFGVEIPTGYAIHGIDISHHQMDISWNEVASIDVKGVRIQFAFIKATEGITRQDQHFSRNWRKCKSAGLIRGAYHFYYPTRDAKQQAENFIKQVDLLPGDLPPVLDVEVSKHKSKAEIVAGCTEWCEIIEEHYGVKPIIYTSPGFYDKYLKDDFKDYPLWIAHYYEELPRMKHRSWDFWQHTDRAYVRGIGKQVDLNVFNGDLEDLKDLCLD